LRRGSLDQAAIARIIHDYADAIDEGDFQCIAGLFASGCLALHERDADKPIVLDGAEAIVAFLTDVAKIVRGPARTRHCVSNIKTDIEADGAIAVATFVVFHLSADQGTQPATVGRYRWSFAGSAGSWTVKRLDIFAEYRGA